MSYITYTKLKEDKKRPLTFMTNGEPGLSSLIFNFMNAGPKLIHIKNKKTGEALLKDNPHT